MTKVWRCLYEMFLMYIYYIYDVCRQRSRTMDVYVGRIAILF